MCDVFNSAKTTNKTTTRRSSLDRSLGPICQANLG